MLTAPAPTSPHPEAMAAHEQAAFLREHARRLHAQAREHEAEADRLERGGASGPDGVFTHHGRDVLRRGGREFPLSPIEAAMIRAVWDCGKIPVAELFGRRPVAIWNRCYRGQTSDSRVSKAASRANARLSGARIELGVKAGILALSRWADQEVERQIRSLSSETAQLKTDKLRSQKNSQPTAN